MSRYVFKGSIVRYFFKLTRTPKPNFKKATEKEISDYKLKIVAGNAFFFFNGYKHLFLHWLTQYYPFSMLYPWQLFHSKNSALKKVVDFAADTIDGLKIPITYGGWDHDQYNAILYFRIYLKIADLESTQKKLERIIQKKYANVYVRTEDKVFKLIVPLDQVFLHKLAS